MMNSDHPAANRPSITRAHTELLLEIASTAKPFSSDHGQAFVSLPLGGSSHQVFSLRDGRFRDWLVHHFYRRHEIFPEERALGLSEQEILPALDLSAPPPSDPVAVALLRFMRRRASWTGAATELLARLRPRRDQPCWPRTPKGLSERLRKLNSSLDQSGIEIEFSRARSIRVTHRDAEVRQK